MDLLYQGSDESYVRCLVIAANMDDELELSETTYPCEKNSFLWRWKMDDELIIHKGEENWAHWNSFSAISWPWNMTMVRYLHQSCVIVTSGFIYWQIEDAYIIPYHTFVYLFLSMYHMMWCLMMIPSIHPPPCLVYGGIFSRSHDLFFIELI